jgi:thiamine pyrophosphate-dependent acetolactate synthase large subunit-like protein
VPPGGGARWRDDDGMSARELERRGRLLVLAGPGVVDAAALPALRAFAAAGDLGVANTWGAKGVFAWDSPHHLGTCGLQARDFELLGVGDADAVVTVGLDPDESPIERLGPVPTLRLDPGDLVAATGRVARTGAPLPNELYPRLAAVAQPGYVDDKVPLHPARAVAALGAVVPPGGLVTAEPGLAGWWVARVFPTPGLDPGAPRRVVVPARRDPGVAVRRAVAAAATGRPAVAVVAAPLDAGTDAAIAQLTRAHGPLVVEVWSDQASLPNAGAHRERLAAALVAGAPRVLEVPVCLEDTEALVAAAGPLVAWSDQ